VNVNLGNANPGTPPPENAHLPIGVLNPVAPALSILNWILAL
jgi:hypothetical protein